MKTSIIISATLGMIFTTVSYATSPARAESLSGGPLYTQSSTHAGTQNESKAEVNDDSKSRGQMYLPIDNPNAKAPTSVLPAPADTRARTVQERQGKSSRTVEIASGKSRASKKISSNKAANKAAWKVTNYKYKNGKPSKISTTYSTKTK